MTNEEYLQTQHAILMVAAVAQDLPLDAFIERARRDGHGRFYWTADYSYLGELVAVGDRILKLFENNTDEVFVIERGTVDIPVQLNLFEGS